MPKSELNVPNSDGLTYRNTVNSALQSLASMQAGSGGATSVGTLPATTYENQLFYDASDGKIKQKQAGSWVVIGDRAENGGLATKAAPAFTGAATFSGSVSITATSFFQLPSGTDAQRPGSPAAGMLRWNSEQARFEGYYGSTWDVLTTSLPLADDSVTTAKLLDGAVTKSKLASSVTRGQVKGRKLGMNLYNVYTRAVNTPLTNIYHSTSILSYDLIDTYGRGNIRTTSFSKANGSSFISTNGDVYTWGTSYYYSISTKNYTLYEPTLMSLRSPKWLHELYFGDSSLNTLDTKVMPMAAASPRESFTRRTGTETWSVMFETGNTYQANMSYPYPAMPKVVEHYPHELFNHYLTENGCLFVAGYGGTSSLLGNGWSGTSVQVPTEVQFFNTDGTHLSGTSKPKIIHFACTQQGGSGISGGSSTLTFYALDNAGYVYSWGDNVYGQLGNNTTGGSQHYAKRIDPVRFGNEPVYYITAGGSSYGHAFAVTGTGKCYGWGRNSHGQLGIMNTTDANAPESLTTMTGNNLYQKAVVHVITTDFHTTTYPGCHTLFLTTTGEVFACGYAKNHGEYLGVYQTSTDQNITNPTKLTDHPDVANEKVLAMYLFGSSHNAQSYLITEGVGGRRLAYSFGNNATGQLGRTTATTSPASASGQFANGTSDESWFCRQIKYRDYGDTELATSAVTGANETIGYSNELSGGNTIWYGSQGGTQWRPMGNPCAFFSDSDGYYNYSTVVMIDSRGTCWTCGKEPLSEGVNIDSTVNSTGGVAYEWYFARWLQQPEQGVGFMFNTYNSGTLSFTFLGESGTVYVGGYNSSYALGKPYNNGYYPVTPLAITTG